MKLFDQQINEIKKYAAQFPGHVYSEKELRQMRDEGTIWQVLDKEELILRSEMAYELGGGFCETVSGIAFTTDKNLVAESSVTVIGPDLKEIHKDCSYARITLIRLSEQAVESNEDAWYTCFRKVDYVRYHIHPKGYMMRISSRNEREPVRIAESALKAGITFAQVGACFHKEYEKLPEVEAVATYFITEPQVDYAQLKNEMHRCEQITDSMNHIYENLKMDCSVCGLKPICDEVDGLRELHQQHADMI